MMTMGSSDVLLTLLSPPAQGGVIPAPLLFPYMPVTAVSNARGTVAALSKDKLEGICDEIHSCSP